MSMVITEALAEIKTVGKRLEKKRANVVSYLARQEGAKDPLASAGGTAGFIESERQAISDLEQRVVQLRRQIRRTNEETKVTISGVTRSIADWLTWRREVAPGLERFLKGMKAGLDNLRETAGRERRQVWEGDGNPGAKPTDYVVNIDEAMLLRQIEELDEVLGKLDGALSLVNATVMMVED